MRIDLHGAWDPKHALRRVLPRLLAGDVDMRDAWLLDRGEAPERFTEEWLVADLDHRGQLVFNASAVFGAGADLCAEIRRLGAPTMQPHQVRAYGRLCEFYSHLQLAPPSGSLSIIEYQRLTVPQLSIRLRSLGLSQAVVRRIIINERDASSFRKNTKALTEIARAMIPLVTATVEQQTAPTT